MNSLGSFFGASLLVLGTAAASISVVAQTVGPRAHIHVGNLAFLLATPVKMLNECGDPLNGRAELEGIIEGVFSAEQKDMILKQYDSAYRGSGKPIVTDCKTFKADSSKARAQKTLNDIRQLSGK